MFYLNDCVGCASTRHAIRKMTFAVTVHVDPGTTHVYCTLTQAFGISVIVMDTMVVCLMKSRLDVMSIATADNDEQENGIHLDFSVCLTDCMGLCSFAAFLFLLISAVSFWLTLQHNCK